MKYFDKLEYTTDTETPNFVRGLSNLKLPEPNSPERFRGITYESLKSLSPDDWSDWLVDRMALGEYRDLCSEKYALSIHDSFWFPAALFMDLIKKPSSMGGKNAQYRAQNQQYIQNMIQGIVKAGRKFLDESIQQEVDPQKYAEARHDLYTIIRTRFSKPELCIDTPRGTKMSDEDIIRDLNKALNSLQKMSV